MTSSESASSAARGTPNSHICSHGTDRVALVGAGDIDGNTRLSYAEFSKVLNRIPDFSVKFRMCVLCQSHAVHAPSQLLETRGSHVLCASAPAHGSYIQ